MTKADGLDTFEALLPKWAAEIRDGSLVLAVRGEVHGGQMRQIEDSETGRKGRLRSD